jgi:pyruvate/2-oxoglutarate dehydrogenase complex dihydrolipoamide dehydrogenase (E3) component
MAVDYDLVIIGATKVGLDLAIKAAQKDARIAWVCASELGYDDLEFGLDGNELGQKLGGSRSQHGKANRRYWFDYCQKLGIDLIATGGTFISPRSFALKDRQLNARTFAIALPQPQPHRAILGIEPQFLKHDLFNQPLDGTQSLPRSLVLIGNDSFSCAIAQRLAQQRKEITLLVDSQHILPNCELDIVRYLQAKMEADGIRIYTSTQVNAIERLENFQNDSDSKFNYRIWINNDQLPNRFFDCEGLFLPNHISTYQNLQLGAARVAQKDGRVLLNQHLQTSNHRIYWCESDADLVIVLANTLYFPLSIKKHLSYIAETQPNLVSLGLTEIDARLKYGKDLISLILPLKDGIAKLLCRQNGEIIAIHCMGIEARQITETILIAIRQRLKIQELDQSLAILRDFASQFSNLRKHKKNVTTLTGDFWWHWFNFRRNWDL